MASSAHGPGLPLIQLVLSSCACELLTEILSLDSSELLGAQVAHGVWLPQAGLCPPSCECHHQHLHAGQWSTLVFRLFDDAFPWTRK
jgi:hypothetical protein